MADDSALDITPELRVPLSELEYRASRSGGPGGQHVNTSSTRIEVWWDVAGSPSLSPEQRAQLLERLRSVIASALAVRKKRKPTRPSRAAKAARLDAKRRRAATKRDRRPPGERDD